jgi:hypothetical protein
MMPDVRDDQVRAIALRYLTGEAMKAVEDPDDPFTLEDLTTWRLEVEHHDAEVDPADGMVLAPAYASVVAYDQGHHSNVLSLTIEGGVVTDAG